MVDQKSDRVVLLYGTKYGATEDTAKWIASPVDVINTECSYG